MASELIMPQLGLTMTEGTVSQWLKREGDVVKKGEEVVEVETDKINNIVEAPEDGILLKIVAQEGDILPVKGVLGIIGAVGEEVVQDSGNATVPQSVSEALAVNDQAAAISEVSGAIPVQNTSVDGWVLATPYARFLARRNGINLAFVSGSGPHGRIIGSDIFAYEEENKIRISPTAAKIASSLGVNTEMLRTDGRIMKADVFAAVEGVPTTAFVTNEPVPAVSAGTNTVRDTDRKGTKLKGMRKVIAQRLSEGWRNTPHVHHTVEIDMTEAVKLRATFKAMDKKFTFTDLIVKAYGKVLKEYTSANDSLVDDCIIHHEEINIGVAVAVNEGLIVPVIRNADRLGLMDIHKKVGELAERARSGRLSPDELQGGTCTVSNLGMYGCDHFTPIVNPPEATILGVCRTVEKPVVRNGEVIVAPMMNAVLGYDHRVIDGATAGLVTARLREYLENPLLLL